MNDAATKVQTRKPNNAAGSFPLDFAFMLGEPKATAILRQQIEDFRVDEELGFDLSGEGEHVYLQIEKKNQNTLDVVDQIARLASVRRMDVGYAGLKDRRAITRQWFSVYLPLDDQVQWQELNNENIKLLSETRHKKKLRRGQHKANRFCICLRNLSCDVEELEERLKVVSNRGVPNYFGPQRFGINGNNLLAADKLLSGERSERNRKKRGLYLSAARSYLFNLVLSERIKDSSWHEVEEGDITSESIASEPLPTGPLWGRGRLQTSARILALESKIAERYEQWCTGLEHVGLKQERRPLSLTLNDLDWDISGKNEERLLDLRFSLPPGSYATSVIRELCIVHTVV